MAGIFRKLMEFMFLGRGPGVPGIASSTPEGLQLIYSASNPSEADMLRQVLTEAGYRVEFVPSSSTGIFGTSGSADVYVAAADAEAATAYLNDYLGSN